MKLTITEALAEIKTIGKRIEKKRQSIGQYLARQDMLKDPLAGEAGGSAGFIARERQAATDLATRWIRLRTAIQQSNLTEQIAVGSVTRTVAEWLTWRREISAGEQGFLNQLRQSVANVRQQATTKGVTVRSGSLEKATEALPTDVIVNIDEAALAKEIEAIEVALGGLDGQLSLKNATTFIEIAD